MAVIIDVDVSKVENEIYSEIDVYDNETSVSNNLVNKTSIVKLFKNITESAKEKAATSHPLEASIMDMQDVMLIYHCHYCHPLVMKDPNLCKEYPP